MERLEKNEITDDEIKKCMLNYNITDFGQMAAFITGAKWAIEKLNEMAPICSQQNENVKVLTHYDYWVRTLNYWEEEMEKAKIGSEYYGLCNVRVGILRDIFKCIE
jgi:hypothetical protein